MDYRELKQALATWKVIVASAGSGSNEGLVIYPAVKKPEDEWRAIWQRLIPHVRRHEWAIRQHLLKPWTVEKVMAYLQEWGIGVNLKDGSPALIRNAMDEETWQYHTRTILPHLKANRAAVIEWFQSFEGAKSDTVMKPHEERSFVFDVLTKMIGPAVRGRVVWFSQYTRETGYLQADARFFPADATAAAVVDEKEGLVIEWRMIPGHTPPKGWKLSSGVMPPYPCLPPPGWKPKTSEQIRKERSRWYAENWKTAGTFKEDEET